MGFLYSLLNNIYIILQVIFWLIIFYWLDFDLFTYILNDRLKIKVILGTILGCNHLFLFRYLYILSDTDSIYLSDNENKELENRVYKIRVLYIDEKYEFYKKKK